MRKKYNIGGALESLSPLADMALPGLGTALNFASSFIQQGALKKEAQDQTVSNLTEKTINTNPYGYALGGLLKNRNYYKGKQFSTGGLLTGKEDAALYKGKSHAQGGISASAKGTPTLNGQNEIEGDETKFSYKDKEYIFSDKLIIE